MTGAFAGVAAAALLAATGLLVAATVRLRGVPRLLLAAYVVAFAEIVVLILVLSAFEAVTRPAILVGLGGVFAAALALWFALGAPRPAMPRPRVRVLRQTPLVLVLGVVTAVALAYVVALVVGTPPNNWDALSYHLARAALWSQNDEVGSIADAYDARLDAHPPNAEIALTFLLELGRNERLAGFVQLTAALALAVGVFALARSLGRPRREAAFGALVFLTLPIVLLQATTAQNDLVAASFLLAASVFLFGSSRGELAVAALATALAIGTKVPAVYGLPLLAALALLAQPTAFRARRLAAVFVGAGVGSYWYLVNLVRTDEPLGDLAGAESEDLNAILEPTENLLAGYARVLDAIDLSGAMGNDRYLYVFVGLAVAGALLVRARGAMGGEVRPALLTGTLVVAPLALIPLGYALWRVFAKLHDVLDEPDRRLPVERWDAQTTASDNFSWFGPVGLLLVVGVGAATPILVRRRSLPPLALLLAVAPLVWFLLFALSVAYDPWQGRFFVFPVALSAALWGLVLTRRSVATAAVAVASTTAALSLVHYAEKPSGLALLERDAPRSAWRMERWYAQSIIRGELRPALHFLEEEVPSHADVALALGHDDFGYPAFGPRLERRVELVPEGSNARRSGADVLLANPGRAREIDRTCWRPELTTPSGWIGFRRAVACPS